MSKGARVRAGRTRAAVMEHRAAIRERYHAERDENPDGMIRLFAGLLKSGRNRHERRRDAARARRHRH
jgi:hypothetical protein